MCGLPSTGRHELASLTNSRAISGSRSRIVCHFSAVKHQLTQSCSALTVAVRRVSLKNGSSPQGRPATMISKYRP
ncbi:hypothetical protein CBS63078_2995 [Aspergillus niger]|nr:hypothetical protein CBS115989_10260 [Aspergillus niger]KAI2838955.1 hypothetical protein CBS11350_7873 [Aspergillus niger]KAI2839558.1 hypothetical protein CBS11232_9339 [Aspergillus niger]KAI2879215.1 hypothetical protein CBS115988_2371 [Aspergillus niger]KAI2903348.1 hypothetical protein CBS13152_1078 [Aspergillus niger]